VILENLARVNDTVIHSVLKVIVYDTDRPTVISSERITGEIGTEEVQIGCGVELQP